MTPISTAVADSGALPLSPTERRLQAFCSPIGIDVFHSIVYQQQIWLQDALDVESIHAEARLVFQGLLDRATTQPPPTAGRLLLLLGASGSGKTHLMRAFRNRAHASEQGYCGYLQMTSQASNYARYLLSNLIDSLDQPFLAPGIQTSGLMRLSLGLLDAVPQLMPDERERLQMCDFPDLAAAIEGYADRLLMDPRFGSCDLDLIRALLYLQRDDPRIKNRLFKWLRCEDLSRGDRAMIGDLVPRCQEHEPLQMITRLGLLINAVHGMALGLFVDQLEDTFDQEHAAEQFRRAVDTLTIIADKVPSSVVVISCLEDYYVENKKHLGMSKIDRLQMDPEPIKLINLRSLEEIEAIVGKRLDALYAEVGVPPDPAAPTFPFTRSHLAPLTALRTRDVLSFCQQHREKCMRLGRWVEPTAKSLPPAPPPAPPALDQAWNDYLASFQASLPDDEAGLARLAAWAVKQCSQELPAETFFGTEQDGRMVRVEVHGRGNTVDKLLLAVCDKAAQGGGLGKQITEAEKAAGEITVVLLRSTAFPTNAKAAVSKQIAGILKRGGRRVEVENADWRTMLAFQEFHKGHAGQAQFGAWVRTTQPLTQLPSLRAALALEELRKARPVAPTPPAPAPSPPSENPKPTNGAPPMERRTQPPEGKPPAAEGKPPPAQVKQPETGPLELGVKGGLTPGAVMISLKELTQHMAFLGGSGSGKTTAALNVIEQLLERGIPAVLLDRKGDLCRYADPSAWDQPLADAERSERLRRLRERLDVAVFTPGQPDGRPLTIPIMPEDTHQLSTRDRELMASYAAAALGSMIGYRSSRADQQRLAILRKAIEIMAATPGVRVSVENLRSLIDERDDALLTAVGGFEDRQYKILSEELLALSLNHRNLLAIDAEQLDVEALLGIGQHARPGKTRLSIISTRFLPDAATVDFWVSQLLAAVGRWIGKNPKDQLQAAFLFDEADLYLPAVRQPATKAPMENLLRRARSAGVGLLLATQSPGDFDYKCRENIRAWLVGRIKEDTALNKLKPMLSDFPADIVAKLPSQETGEFYLLRARERGPGLAEPPVLDSDGAISGRANPATGTSGRADLGHCWECSGNDCFGKEKTNILTHLQRPLWRNGLTL